MNNRTRSTEVIQNQIAASLLRRNIAFNVIKGGTLTLRQGSTAVAIKLIQKGDSILVYIFAAIAMEIDRLSTDLMLYLLIENHKLHLCKFSFEAETRSIWLEYTLLGETLDEKELMLTLETIALTADQYDDQIAMMSGGKRATDL